MYAAASIAALHAGVKKKSKLLAHPVDAY